MERNTDLNQKIVKRSKNTVDLHKMMQIVEGGFNTQDINAAFDYDLVSSDDDSSLSPSISSEESVTNYNFSCFNSVPVLNWAPTS